MGPDKWAKWIDAKAGVHVSPMQDIHRPAGTNGAATGDAGVWIYDELAKPTLAAG